MISFFVQGIAKPAGSKRGFALKKGGVFTGRVVITDDCKTSRDWKTDVSYAAKQFYKGPPLKGPLSVQMIFQIKRPKGHFGTGRNAENLREGAPDHPTSIPDLIKLTRAVEDACTGILWEDDAQIVEHFLAKRYPVAASPPGVYVQVSEILSPAPATPANAGTAPPER